MKISNEVLDSLNSINTKGYVNLESLDDPSHFIKKIEGYLVKIGYNWKGLIIIPTPLGYNFIFFNLFLFSHSGFTVY